MKFLSDLPFSFLYGGRPFREQATVTTETDQDTVITRCVFPDGLTVTNTARYYADFDVWEWFNTFAFDGVGRSERISRLWDGDVMLPLPHEDDRRWTAYFPDEAHATKIYAPNGSTWTKKEFFCEIDALEGNARVNHIEPGQTRTYRPTGGRSSQTQAPFFNVGKDGHGYVFAVGWTGQWHCEISRQNDSLRFRSGIEDADFVMLPGERFRTSSVVVMPYEGDFITVQNQWRRLVKTHFSLVGTPGRDPQGPLCAGIWGGMTTASVIKRLNVMKENDFPFDYVWMDAGWYGAETRPTPDEFEGDWGTRTGDWRVSPHIHTNGLRDVADAAHKDGKKFLLWFEPERVIDGTPITREHPEYFLRRPDASLLLDLGNPQAWQYCFDTLCERIEAIGIDCYRQDFNFDPLPYWREYDAPDRRGITEIKHINGMYALWDALLARFPHLLIDNCASGGRRIDIETLRRSIPLWRSDYQCPANYDVESAQMHNQTFNAWMPYSGTGSGRAYDEYRVRSAYGPAMTVNWFYSEREPFADTPEKRAFIKKYTEEYRAVRPYFSEDFYPLTEVTECLDVWCANQFHRPEKDDGIVQLFRREKAPYSTASFPLRGLDADRDYLFTDADDGTSFTVSGQTLLTVGLTVTISEKRKAKIFFYRSTI